MLGVDGTSPFILGVPFPLVVAELVAGKDLFIVVDAMDVSVVVVLGRSLCVELV